jgi:hypothetical protein
MTKPPANTGKPWTGQQIADLAKLAKGNTPTRLIALKTGRSEAAVRSKVADLDLSLKPVNQSPYGPRKPKGRP